MSVHLEAFEWTGEPKRIFIAGALNEAVPISVLWVGSEIPGVLLKKFETVYWVCIGNGLPSVRDTYYTFLSPTLAPLKYKDWFLTQQTSQGAAILDSLEEFREKKAGLVVCPNRTVKWYDADSKTRGAEISVEDVCEVLKWCTGQLEGSDD